MRRQSDIKVTVKNKIIGGPAFLICIPLLAMEKDDLFREAATIKRSDPDLVEWRIDGYRHVQDINNGLTPLRNCESNSATHPWFLPAESTRKAV